eukprot:COSAG02_NODE_92_length_37588_cov_135.916242_24_plen_81_part_00
MVWYGMYLNACHRQPATGPATCEPVAGCWLQVGRWVQVSRSKVTVEKSEQAPNVGRGGLQHANLCFSGWLQQVGPSAACI